MVPRVAMFTMAGETFLIIGDREGTGVSPTAEGMAAGAIGAAAARTSQAEQTREVDFMPRSYLRRHRESVPPHGGHNRPKMNGARSRCSPIGRVITRPREACSGPN